MKLKFYVSFLIASFLMVGCAKDQKPGVSPYSQEKELTQFGFLKANNPSLDKDYQSTFDGQTINIELPKGINVKELIPTFTVSEKAILKIGNNAVKSDITPVDFSQSLQLTVEAQNKSTIKYYPAILLIGVTQDLNANKKTSYNDYIQNNLYIDFSTAIPKTALNVNYFEDAYNARAYGDFDKDGDLDIIAGASNAYGNAEVGIEYFRNDVFSFNKDQTVFSNGAPKMLNARKAIVVDLDKNGWLDVVFVGSGFDRAPYAGESMKVLMNNNGKFTVKDLTVPKGYMGSVTAGDIDNDGDVDLFITDTKGISRFLINDGTAGFKEDLTTYPGEFFGKAYFASELYDINNDGYLDLVTGGHEFNGAETIILLGNASGNFMTSRMVKVPAVSGFGIVVDIDFIDYDKDGKTDVLITRTGDGKQQQGFYIGYYLQLLKNNGANKFDDVSLGSLKDNSDPKANKWINLIRVQDIDNDGDLDITTDDKFYGLAWINNNGVFSKN